MSKIQLNCFEFDIIINLIIDKRAMLKKKLKEENEKLDKLSKKSIEQEIKMLDTVEQHFRADYEKKIFDRV